MVRTVVYMCRNDKRVSCVGFLLPAACLIGAAFVKCDAVLSACLLVVSASLLGLSMSCWAVNHLDLAPPFAGKRGWLVPKYNLSVESNQNVESKRQGVESKMGK